MIRLTPRAPVSPAHAAAAPIIAAVLALVLAAIPLALSGAPVLRAYGLAAMGALGSAAALSETLARAVPLILTGLATSLALRISLYNFGAEGQLLAGALATLAIGTGAVVAPSSLMIPLVIIGAAIAGAALMLLAVLIKLRRGADEAVVTLLLNVVMLLALQMTLTGPLDITTATVRSQPLIEQATLAELGSLRLALGILLAVAAVALVSAMLRYTVWGFDIRAIGGNAVAAQSSGIQVARTMVWVGSISGVLAGLAGAFEVTGRGYLTQDIAGLGYAGIAVAVLAGRSIFAIIPAALFFAVVLVGAGSLNGTGVSRSLADSTVALTILLALIAGLLTRYRIEPRRSSRTEP